MPRRLQAVVRLWVPRRLRLGCPCLGPPACPGVRLLDHLGHLEQERRGDREAEGLRGFQVEEELEPAACSTGKSAGLAPFKILSTDLLHLG